MKHKWSIAVFLCVFTGTAFSQINEFSVDSIKAITKKCAKYRISRGVNKLTDAYGTNQKTWDIGAYMTGIMALYRITGEQWVLDSATKWSLNTSWASNAGVNTTNGDDQCCEQTFCEIYLLNKKPADLTVMAKPSFDNMKQMFDVNKSTGRARWWWSDALYMSPPAIARVFDCYKTDSAKTANRLLDSMDVYWKDCAAFLYSTQYKLWFRDGGYIYPAVKTANGSPVFWSGCNAWAIAGLARVLQFMPATYKSRPYYEQQFRDLCDALRKAPALGTDGLWRTSLLDYNQFPEKESIASAFFAFAYAWGINNGLLDRAVYEPLVRKTWTALVGNIGTDGRLQWCQTINAQPDHVTQSFTAPEGEGAFMLLGEELIKLVTATQIKHRLLLADEGGLQVLLVDQFNPANNWTTSTPNNNRDMQLVGNNRVMVTDPTGGFVELDITTGAVKKTAMGFGAVQAATRLINGNTLLCGDNLSGKTGVTIVEIDSLKSIKRTLSFPGYSNVRLMRVTPQNTYFFGANDSLLLESDSTGKIISNIAIKGARNVYQAVRLKNGNILVSTGYGATILEIKQTGEIVKTYGGASDPQASLIKPYFYNSFQVLKNGHLVTTNWQGHGAGHGGVGIQVLEYDTTGAMVWYWKDSTKYSSLHTVIVLDSLNTQLLHDDRYGGVLNPVIPPLSIRNGTNFRIFESPEINLTSGSFSGARCFNLLGKSILPADREHDIISVHPFGFYVMQKGNATRSFINSKNGGK